MTKIVAKKDLFNGGRCFTAGKEYTVNRVVVRQSSLMEEHVLNDLGQPHRIGNWYKSFTIKY